MNFEKEVRGQMKRLKFKNEREFLDFLKGISTMNLTKREQKKFDNMWKNIEVQRKTKDKEN